MDLDGRQVNEANHPEFSDLICPILLWQEDDVGRVEQLEACTAQIKEGIDSLQKVVLYDIPTLLKECSCEAIRAQCLIRGQMVYGTTNLLLSERRIKGVQVSGLYLYGSPIEVHLAPGWVAHNVRKVFLRDRGLLHLCDGPT